MSHRTHRSGQLHPPLSNDEVAEQLEEAADLLEKQEANVFRVQAYRNAARNIRGLDLPLAALLADETKDGDEDKSKDEAKEVSALQQLPGIGVSLARSIDHMLHTGHLPLLDQLRGGSGPEAMFSTVPGIGQELAARIHDVLGIETLHELEGAAHDGRLARVHGFGRRRVQAIRETLAGRSRRRPPVPESRPRSTADDPPVEELLDIDDEYRRKADADRLPRIAPKRFNPGGKAWLHILHAHRADRHYTALHSNTARAHELGTTRDWVVIYRDDHDGRGQWTVVTAQFGDLRGKRIVRGREKECRAHYALPAGSTV